MGSLRITKKGKKMKDISDIDPLDQLSDYNILLTRSQAEAIKQIRKKYHEYGTEEEREAYINRLANDIRKKGHRYIS
tara:strand:+ start:1132 stop:1362 length:231 start_codon:yes stop_codon:yes gene_type:complete